MSQLIIKQCTDACIKWPIYDTDAQPVDLTGWIGEGQIRALNTDKLIHSFTNFIGNLYFVDNYIYIVWTNAESSAWTWRQANLGIELTNLEGKKLRLFQGVVILSREVVR